jgi:hypothetical protein
MVRTLRPARETFLIAWLVEVPAVDGSLVGEGANVVQNLIAKRRPAGAEPGNRGPGRVYHLRLARQAAGSKKTFSALRCARYTV